METIVLFHKFGGGGNNSEISYEGTLTNGFDAEDYGYTVFEDGEDIVGADGNVICSIEEYDNTKRGVFDFDGEYDTMYWQPISECNTKEIELILEEEFRLGEYYINKELIAEITGYSPDVVDVICHFEDLKNFFDDGVIDEDFLISSFEYSDNEEGVEFRGKKVINID